jgi:hypothetical protein
MRKLMKIMGKILLFIKNKEGISCKVIYKKNCPFIGLKTMHECLVKF